MNATSVHVCSADAWSYARCAGAAPYVFFASMASMPRTTPASSIAPPDADGREADRRAPVASGEAAAAVRARGGAGAGGVCASASAARAGAVARSSFVVLPRSSTIGRRSMGPPGERARERVHARGAVQRGGHGALGVRVELHAHAVGAAHGEGAERALEHERRSLACAALSAGSPRSAERARVVVGRAVGRVGVVPRQRRREERDGARLLVGRGLEVERGLDVALVGERLGARVVLRARGVGGRRRGRLPRRPGRDAAEPPSPRAQHRAVEERQEARTHRRRAYLNRDSRAAPEAARWRRDARGRQPQEPPAPRATRA